MSSLRRHDAPFPEATLIPEEDRQRMLAVALCGPRVLWRLQSIGIRRFSDLSGKDPFDLMDQINIEAGRCIWRPPKAIEALSNLIEAADELAPND